MKNNVISRCYHSSDSRAGKVLRIIGMVFVGLIFAVLFALIFGFLVKWLWNFLMPELFGLTQITYWQAFSMVILTKLLFGAFGKHDHARRHPHLFGKWHDRLHCSEDEPWNRQSRQWKSYKQYWHHEGKAAFEAYVQRNDKEREAGNGSPSKTPNKEEHDD